jgi:hypothetical protein
MDQSSDVVGIVVWRRTRIAVVRRISPKPSYFFLRDAR